MRYYGVFTLLLGVVLLAGQAELTPSRRDVPTTDLPNINVDFIIEDGLSHMEGDDNMKRMMKELKNEMVLNLKQKDVEDIYNQMDFHFQTFITNTPLPKADVPKEKLGDMCAASNDLIETIPWLLDQMTSTVAPDLKMLPRMMDVMTEEIVVSRTTEFIIMTESSISHFHECKCNFVYRKRLR